MGADLQIVKNTIETVDLLDFQKEMLETIDRVDKYSWEKDKIGGFDFGDHQLNKAFNGFQPKVHIIAGSPNIGKSALSLQIAWQVAMNNEDAYVLYFSLDDMDTETLPRVIASDQRLDISVIANPKKYESNTSLMTRRAKGFDRVKKALDRFKIIDRRTCQSIEQVDSITTQHKTLASGGLGKKVCVFVDALNNLDVEKNINDKQEKMAYISRTLKDVTEMHNIPIMATTHLKKLNGHRRPMADDIKETNDIQYDACAILLCYSEIGIKGQTSKVYHEEVGNEEKLPVLEAHVVKNKLGSFKSRMFWDFFPDHSHLQSVPPEGIKRYNAYIMS